MVSAFQPVSGDVTRKSGCDVAPVEGLALLGDSLRLPDVKPPCVNSGAGVITRPHFLSIYSNRGALTSVAVTEPGRLQSRVRDFRLVTLPRVSDACVFRTRHPSQGSS